MERKSGTVGGWAAPCEKFDFRKMEWEARRECQAIKERLDLLKRQKPKDAEAELLRRAEVRMLTDIYYEQKSNVRLFEAKAEQREAQEDGRPHRENGPPEAA